MEADLSTATPAGPPPELRYKRPYAFGATVRDIYSARPIIRALAERELRAAYKQAFLGMAWAIVTPVTLMLVFSLVFTRVAKVDTGGVPYQLFSYIALVPWQFFSSSVNSGGLSLVTQMNLVNKIRCPREVFPLSSICTSGVNALIATTVLLILFAINTFMPKPTTVWVPVILLLQLMFTVGATLLVSCITIYLRDLRHALPILLQLALFATPVAYPIIDELPSWARIPYVIINPMAAVIDSYRETVLYGNNPDFALLLPAFASAAVLLYCASRLFRKLELRFADVA